ncbi:IS66 family insertion sequence element accessory protein TnpB [Paracoccus sp. 22332]|uniref:IS66 family insertion sequence element accessory protein TnpB n=1 Tax=Paracoccus sp. 22332 TaxID=3453913 RepID=UPI003F83D0D3
MWITPVTPAAHRFGERFTWLNSQWKLRAYPAQFWVEINMFRSKRADRLKLLFWDGSGLVMAYKRLEADSFTWPAVRDGAMTLSRTQFEALFSGLDWRRVRPLEISRPSVSE